MHHRKDREPLTRRQRAALDEIRAFENRHRVMPSRRDLADLLGVSVSTAQDLVDRLAQKGYLKVGAGPRNIALL